MGHEDVVEEVEERTIPLARLLPVDEHPASLGLEEVPGREVAVRRSELAVLPVRAEERSHRPCDLVRKVRRISARNPPDGLEQEEPRVSSQQPGC